MTRRHVDCGARHRGDREAEGSGGQVMRRQRGHHLSEPRAGLGSSLVDGEPDRLARPVLGRQGQPPGQRRGPMGHHAARLGQALSGSPQQVLVGCVGGPGTGGHVDAVPHPDQASAAHRALQTIRADAERSQMPAKDGGHRKAERGRGSHNLTVGPPLRHRPGPTCVVDDRTTIHRLRRDAVSSTSSPATGLPVRLGRR